MSLYSELPKGSSRRESVSDQYSDEAKPMLLQDDSYSEQPGTSHYSRRQCVLAAILGSVCTLICMSAVVSMLWLTKADGFCVEHNSFFSPALREISSKYIDIRFNGTLDHPSEYRGPLTHELDVAWERLERVRPLSISGKDLENSGFDPRASARLPEEYGGGYMVAVEVTHQLHCLNFVRKGLDWDYYKDKSPEWADKPDMVRTHLDHCVEMLRQALMCHSDVGVIGHRWVEHHSNPYPDFSVMHKCRNFEEVLGWVYDHQIKERPAGYSFSPQEGEKIWPTPP